MNSSARARWRYVILGAGVLVLAGLVWAGSAVCFSVTHVQASYARVSGLVVSVSAKAQFARQPRPRLPRRPRAGGPGSSSARQRRLAGRSGQSKGPTRRPAERRTRAHAQADWEMTIRQTSATEQQAAAELAAAEARLAQARAESELQAEQQPDDVRSADARLKSARQPSTPGSRARPQEIEQARADVAPSRPASTTRRAPSPAWNACIPRAPSPPNPSRKPPPMSRWPRASLRSLQERLELLLAGTRSEDTRTCPPGRRRRRSRALRGENAGPPGTDEAQAVATRVAEQRQADASLFAARSGRSLIALKAQDYTAPEGRGGPGEGGARTGAGAPLGRLQSAARWRGS